MSCSLNERHNLGSLAYQRACFYARTRNSFGVGSVTTLQVQQLLTASPRTSSLLSLTKWRKREGIAKRPIGIPSTSLVSYVETFLSISRGSIDIMELIPQPSYRWAGLSKEIKRELVDAVSIHATVADYKRHSLQRLVFLF